MAKTKKTPAQKIIEECRANRNAKGVADISSKQVAVLIRDQLKRRWPEMKFSVRSDYSSVNIRWTDGPCAREVDRVLCGYSFGGFDGMIDLAYSSTQWLLPDGTMETASCAGTVGSMGTVEGYVSDCPQPGAVMVDGGPRYVFTNREMSDERRRAILAAIEQEHKFWANPEKALWDQYLPNGECVATEIHRWDERHLEEE